MTFSELRDKEVINLCNGKRMGYVCDVEFDSDCGKICALLLPARLFGVGFKKGSLAPTRIPWSCIDCIGKDLILVKLDALKT